MITSLLDLSPEARAEAESYLGAAASGLPVELRTAVLEELAAHLCERLSPDSTPAEVRALATEAGPVAAETERSPFDRLAAGFRPKGAAERIATTWWSPSDPRILVPRAIGLGWDVNAGAIAVRLGLIEPDAETIPFTATPDRAFLTAASLPATMAIAVALHYLVRGRTLPARLPAHWGLSGAPDRWTTKGRATATDLATTLGGMVLAGRAALSGRPNPGRAGLLAGATLVAGIGAGVTVARSLGERPRPWLPALLLTPGLGGAAAVLLWLARAGRAEEIRRDLASGHRQAAYDEEIDDD